MNWSLGFIIFSVSQGFALAMDAFSVSLANGLNDPKMKSAKMCGVAGVFSLFQFLMPMIGWICVHTMLTYFQNFEKFIPWIALLLLCYIGGGMLMEGITCKEQDCKPTTLGFGALMVQGVATSIDALSVGFTISHYNLLMALVCCLIIGILTFFICMGGLFLGKRFGTRFAGKASMLGGIILIIIGLEIFITGVFHI